MERYHRTMGQYFRAYTQREPGKWHEYLPYAIFTYNITVNSTTGFSPHQLVFGYEVELPTGIINGRLTYNYESYKHELQLQLRNLHEMAKRLIMERKHSNKTYYDRHTKTLILKRNDLVLIKKEVKKHKYDNPYDGPYRVEKVISPAIIRIRKRNKSVVVHNDKLKLVQADHGSDIPPVLPPPDTNEQDNDDDTPTGQQSLSSAQ